MKRILCLLFALSLVLLSAVSVSALDYGCDVDTVSGAVYLENLNNSITVFEKNSTERMYPASTTKIMTYIVTAENVSDLDSTKVQIKESVLEGLDPESTVMGLSEHIGEEFSVKDLLYGMMLPSGNDAALVLADYVGGSVDDFVSMMNSKAAELSCSDTHFVNPHGLYDENHYTTAADLAKIAKYALSVQGFSQVVSTVSYTPKGFDAPVYNTNYMLSPSLQAGDYYYYEYAKGIKTGYTDEAGKCLVSCAEKDGTTYLCVALGADYSYADDINYAMLDSRSLYQWAYDSLGEQTVCDEGETVKVIPVKYADDIDEEVALVPQSKVTAFLPNDYDKSLVKLEISSEEEAEAPIAKGDALGTVTVSYDGVEIGSAVLASSEEINRNELRYAVSKISEFISANLIIVIIAAVIIVALIIFVVAKSSHNRKRRQREYSRRRYK